MTDAFLSFALTAKSIQSDVNAKFGPPIEGLRAQTQTVIMMSLVRGTRGYIEQVANQANGAYENGWYDACAVMVRRLLETLIIEAYEHHKIGQNIKGSSGDYFFLRDMIDKAVSEPSWTLSRNCKRALPKLKEIGDLSAHSRRYNAHRPDIDKLLPDVRLVVQELLALANLK